ncbi:hypothetical protein [Sphingomicrobium clamense]|uniref:Uncharacterized protein n=1 Tax=Sphingomicrobium clamense TaxID=2851013 RepID=A0ABS6V4U0_9SPHN|nr:hypothetical protein [Sphingomicrobium sp. B8]MBW0144217.1 hypothetical protein [Sphingomicrobium sp. B8]
MATPTPPEPPTAREPKEADPRPALFVPVGENFTRLFGQAAATRAYRLAGSAGLEPGSADRLGEEGGRSVLIADLDYVWDPAWLPAMVQRPGTVLTHDGHAIIAHCVGPAQREAVMTAMANDATHALPDMKEFASSERPHRFILPLTPETQPIAARAAFIAGCEPVTDAITVAIRAVPAFHLARWAARIGIGAAAMTLLGVALSMLAFAFFWYGLMWPGLIAGAVSLIAATAGRGLVRAIGTDAPWRPIHGTIAGTFVPPLWYVGFGHGLVLNGADPVYIGILATVAAAGHVADGVARVSFRRSHGFAMRMWRPFDTKFRLIAAGRNVGLLLLGLGTLFRIPVTGLDAVALWTLVSLIVVVVRLAQAEGASLRGQKLEPWI